MSYCLSFTAICRVLEVAPHSWMVRPWTTRLGKWKKNAVMSVEWNSCSGMSFWGELGTCQSLAEKNIWVCPKATNSQWERRPIEAQLAGKWRQTSIMGRNHHTSAKTHSDAARNKLPAASRNLCDKAKQGQLCEINPPPSWKSLYLRT